MKNNYLKLEFLSLPENQAFARDAVAAFCLPLNPTLDMLSDVKTAVSEAVTNCTVHAYRGTAGIVTVECTTEGGVLHILIGVGILTYHRFLFGRVRMKKTKMVLGLSEFILHR